MSGHLNVDAYCLAMSRVYTFRPDLQGRELNTAPTRMLAEFWWPNPRSAPPTSPDADLPEACLKHLVTAVLD